MAGQTQSTQNPNAPLNLDEQKQKIVLESGLHIAVGSDCHRKEEYPAARLYQMTDFLLEKGIPGADLYF